jgi:hypothetical protein
MPYELEPRPLKSALGSVEEPKSCHVGFKLRHHANYDLPSLCIRVAIKNFTRLHEGQVAIDLRLQDFLMGNRVEPVQVIGDGKHNAPGRFYADDVNHVWIINCHGCVEYISATTRPQDANP